ncbi:MAG: acyltransferase [Bdellovibrionales bacterium]|nr:acyltransferase [Bdellovibrionales bacterium]
MGSNSVSTSRDPLAYRPEIDGLRAIAVLAVVAFHVSPRILPGGFIGVDVFFVISGYLITRMIAVATDAGNFSFAEFYFRRVRRLLPSLLTVLFTVWLWGLVDFVGSDFAALGKEMATSAAFAANFQYAAHHGYFEAAAEAKPFLHLWSLGVEEQFYLFWPVVLVALRSSRGRRRSIVYLGLISFTAGLFGSWVFPNATFYLPFGRLWEFMFGAAIGIGRPRESRAADFLAVAGTVLIVAGFFLINSSQVYPGFRASIPTLGTALILLSTKESAIARGLSFPPLRFVGRVSYPFYLWHWPIFVIATNFLGRPAPVSVRLIGAFVAFGLSVLTYRGIELPLRSGRSLPAVERKRTFALLVLLVAAGLVGLATDLTDGFPSRIQGVPSAFEEGNSQQSTLVDAACPIPEAVGGAILWCRGASGGPANRVLIGDSHAQSLYPTLARLSGPEERWLVLAGPGCSPFPDEMNPGAPSACAAFLSKGIRAVSETPEVEWVLFAFHARHASESGVTERALRTLREIRRHGKRLAILIDNPIPSVLPERCGKITPLQRLAPRLNTNCSITREEHEKNSAALRALAARAMREFPGLVVIDPTDRLCDAERCPVVLDGRSLYSYSHHLSDFGASRFVPELLRRLR